MEIELPDGTILDAPDDADPSVVAKKYLVRAKQTPTDPTKGMSGTEKFLAGLGKTFVDAKRSIDQMTVGTGLGGAGLGDNYAPYAKAYYDSETQRGKDIQADIDEAKRLDAPLMKTAAGLAGNVTGNVALAAPTAFIPGAATVPGSAAIGALMGFTQPVASDESRLTNTGIGAVSGAVGNLVPKAVGRMIRPNVRPEVSALIQEGVTPTPGQIIGGAAKRIEEGATSIPILGDAIKSGQRRAIHDFNRAALNRALKPIGLSLEKGTPVGREAIDKVHQAISGAYDDLLPKISGAADDEFVSSLSASLKQSLSDLPESRAKQFENIVMNDVFGKFGNDGKISGDVLKQIQSKVGKLIRRYGSSQDADSLQMSDALKDVGDALRAMLKRQNPDYAPSLDAIDSAYAQLLRVERAASSLGAKEGVFTPAQFTNAVKAMDPSLRKTQFARGNALMQDFAESGKEVLSQTVPDSGTPFRLISNAGIGGLAAYLSPEALAGGLAASSAYSKPGQHLLAAALTKRPAVIENLSPKMLRLADFAKQGVAISYPAYRLSQD